MTHLFSLLPAGGWQRLVCDALWQSTFIGACGWLAARYLVRQSAARAWLLLVALSACGLVPLASVAARQMQWTVFTGQPTIASKLPALPTAAPVISNDEALPGIVNRTINPQELQQLNVAATDEPSSEQQGELSKRLLEQSAALFAAPMPKSSIHSPNTEEVDVRPRMLKVVGMVWLAASSLLALRLAIGALAAWRLLRRVRPCEDQTLLAAASAAAQRVGLARIPRFVVSDQVRTPMVWALGRCCLLVPAADLTGERKIDWTAAFTHELAHVARGDGWARLWAELVAVALPLSPLVWLLKRSFYLACEEACDDWAVAGGTDPVDLADALTAWINVPRRAAPLAAIGMSSSKARTLRLLSLREKPATRLSRSWRWLGIPTAVVLMAGLAIAQTPTGKSKTDAGKSAPATAPKSIGADHPAPSKGAESPYIIEPPDILLIDVVRLAPRDPVRIQPFDTVYLDVGSSIQSMFNSKCKVDSSGEIVLGRVAGSLKVSGLTRREAQDAVENLLKEKKAKDAQVALTIDESRIEKGIAGQHLVGPDGTISLGTYGTVHVDGDNVEQATKAIEGKLKDFFFEPKVAVDIYAYNSKVFYVIVGGPRNRSDSIFRLPITGHETVLDGVAQVPGMRGLSEANIWIVRSTPGSVDQIIAIDWDDALSGSKAGSNPEVLPGDRILVYGARGNYPIPPADQPLASPATSSESPETEQHDSENLKDANVPSHGFY